MVPQDANVEAPAAGNVIPGLQHVEPRNSVALTVPCVRAVGYSVRK